MNRISTNSATMRLLNEIQLSQQRLFESQQRVASGLQLTRPADDPPGVSRVLLMRTSLEQNEQYRRNITVAGGDLAATESGYEQLTGVLQRAAELATQGANSSLDAQDRNSIAIEVSELLTEAIAIGNRSRAGRYLFAGHKTDTTPFVPDVADAPTAVTYAGDTGLIKREIGQGELVDGNVTGDQGFPAVFTALIQLRDHLLANDQAAVNGDSAAVGSALDSVLQLRSDVGLRVQRVEQAEQRLLDEDVVVQGMISQIEDADVADSLVQLQLRETAYQAALGAAGRALNLSLLEFLR